MTMAQALDEVSGPAPRGCAGQAEEGLDEKSCTFPAR